MCGAIDSRAVCYAQECLTMCGAIDSQYLVLPPRDRYRMKPDPNPPA